MVKMSPRWRAAADRLAEAARVAGLDVEITAIDLSQCSVKFKQGTLEWRPPRQLDIGALEDRPSPRLDALIEQARLGLQQRGTR